MDYIAKECLARLSLVIHATITRPGISLVAVIDSASPYCLKPTTWMVGVVIKCVARQASSSSTSTSA